MTPRSEEGPPVVPATRPPTPGALTTSRVLVLTTLWLATALAGTGAGLLQVAGPPFPQAILAALTAGLCVATLAWARFRTWSLAIDARALVLIHATRVVPGVAFLALHAQGLLPWSFAVPGGWGDIAVGLLAVACAAGAPRHGASGRLVLGAFSIVGLADILLVIAVAARLSLADPGSMRALTRLPLGLLVTFLVPIIVWSHLVLLARVGRPAPPGGAV